MSLHSKRVRIGLGIGSLVALGLFGYAVHERNSGSGSAPEGAQIGENLDLSAGASHDRASWTGVLSGLFGSSHREGDATNSESHGSGTIAGGLASGNSSASSSAGGVAGGALATGAGALGAAGVAGANGAKSGNAPSAGSGAALTTAGQAEAAKAPAAPVVEEKPHCETRTFVTAKNERFETNVIALGDLSGGKYKVRTESFCVRVNGAPAKFELDGKAWEVRVGALRKTGDKVAVTYCRGSASCTESCAVAKDPFMEALVGEDGSGDDDSEDTAGWAPDSKLGAEMASREEKELDGELQRFQQVLENGNGPKVKGTNKNWNESAHVEACTAPSVASLR